MGIDRLTRNVLAAEAAGMSYGKYKALLHERGEVPAQSKPDRSEAQEQPRRCEICGKLLHPDARKRTKTCGPACSDELNRRRNRKYYEDLEMFKPDSSIKCAHCGKDFMQNRQVQIFCSQKCQREHNRDIRRGVAVGTSTDMANRSYGIGICPICGKEYTRRSSMAIWCGPECRNAAKKMERAKRKKAMEEGGTNK